MHLYGCIEIIETILQVINCWHFLLLFARIDVRDVFNGLFSIVFQFLLDCNQSLISSIDLLNKEVE